MDQGNARLDGLAADLHVVGSNYNVALMLFFVGYVLFEVPSQLVLKKTNPKLWLPLLAFIWGTITVIQGLVHNQAGLFAIRFFLGVSECGLFPGCVSANKLSRDGVVKLLRMQHRRFRSSYAPESCIGLRLLFMVPSAHSTLPCQSFLRRSSIGRRLRRFAPLLCSSYPRILILIYVYAFDRYLGIWFGWVSGRKPKKAG